MLLYLICCWCFSVETKVTQIRGCTHERICSNFWILRPAKVSRDSCRWLRHVQRPFSHCRGKPVCGFSRNLWWLNVRSGRRCDGFIDLATSIAASSNKLDYDFTSRLVTTWTATLSVDRERNAAKYHTCQAEVFPPSHLAIPLTADC